MYSERVNFTCAAENAWKIMLRCDNLYLKGNHDQDHRFVNGHRTTYAYFNTTKNELNLKKKVKCECVAFSQLGATNGTSFLITNPYLDASFIREPLSKETELGKSVKLDCIPPSGYPKPRVSWLKNGKTFEYIEYTENTDSLIFIEVDERHVANYTCVATNSAGKRLSNEASLTVYRYGGWAKWSEWSPCSSHCGKGVTRRTRICTNPAPIRRPICNGSDTDINECTVVCPTNGNWGEWENWAACGVQCVRHRPRRCNNPKPNNGGSNCIGKMTQSENCTGGLCNKNKAIMFPHNMAGDFNLMGTVLYVGLVVIIAVFIVITMFIVFFFFRRTRMHELLNDNGDGFLAYSPISDKIMMTSKTAERTLYTEHGEFDYCNISHLNPTLQYYIPGLPTPPSSQEIPQSKICMTPLDATYATPDHYSDITDIDLLAARKQSEGERLFRDSRYSDLPRSHSLDDKYQIYVPPSINPQCVAVGIVGNPGGRLSIPDFGVTMLIPEGAIRPGHSHELYLACSNVREELGSLPSKSDIFISGVVHTGPTSFAFQKPIIISCGHSLGKRITSEWKPFLKVPTGKSQWQEPSKENVITHFDKTHCYIVTTTLHNKYCISARPENNASKNFQVAVFSSVLGVGAHTLRVYIISNTPDALMHLIMKEVRMNGMLLQSSKEISLFLTGHAVSVAVEDLSTSWMASESKKMADLTTLFNDTSHRYYVEFSLTSTASVSVPLCCSVVVEQSSACRTDRLRSVSVPILLNPNEVIQTSSILPNYNHSVSVFCLPKYIRHRLNEELRSEWKQFATAFGFDKYLISYLSQLSNPVDTILNIWEAKTHNNHCIQLSAILHSIYRPDLATLLDYESEQDLVRSH